ncbi:MAG TPA: hypothetical protein GX707_03160 [Epulopiscium sp.]|nr:hypothetical protein [Candidatus Epulonipiscium sp.]
MIKREKNYLTQKKKKYILMSVIWLFIMFGIFWTGYILNNTRNNVFTVFAAVLVLPAAQYMTQLFAILKFKDPDIEASNQLELIKGNYNLFHSVLIPDLTEIIYFDHIVVTGTKIYCIIDNVTDIAKQKEIFDKKIKAKGISLKAIVYVDQNKTKDMGNLFKQIEVNAAIENEINLKEQTQLITQMMM